MIGQQENFEPLHDFFVHPNHEIQDLTDMNGNRGTQVPAPPRPISPLWTLDHVITCPLSGEPNSSKTISTTSSLHQKKFYSAV